MLQFEYTICCLLVVYTLVNLADSTASQYPAYHQQRQVPIFQQQSQHDTVQSTLRAIAQAQHRGHVTIFSEQNPDVVRFGMTWLAAIYDDAMDQSAHEHEQGNLTGQEAIGPFMSVNKEARRLSREGYVFTQTCTALAGSKSFAENSTFRGNAMEAGRQGCPFKEPLSCDNMYKYRTPDGSCNNLVNNNKWGKANTPFERFIQPRYEDDFSSVRSKSVQGTSLPLPREISTRIHSSSSLANLHHDLNHVTMEFGQFISHDVNGNTLSTGINGSSLICCKPDGTVDESAFKKTLGCLPIEIPADDPYFSQFNKRCMNFVRAAPTMDLDCTSGYREQLNQVTHFIDGSTVYGSDEETMNDLRLTRDGLLKVTPSPNGDLLLQNSSDSILFGCITSGNQHCFKAGEVRVNQQPALMVMHTIWLREHNRVARGLKTINPRWNDEKLFQEARKIVGAELQHITFSHYLPAILGPSLAQRFGFVSQPSGSYFTQYDSSFKPSIRNGFVAAAYRFGHSMVRDTFARDHLFKDHFLKPEVLYDTSKGPSFVANNLVTSRQQSTDNLMSSQLTNHLFERKPGGGLDLASINIQRGRDHGLAGYNEWRDWCGLPRAVNFFSEEGGLVDHSSDVAALLGTVYSHPDDIDLWTGIVSEMSLQGRAVGPTGACIIARQFWILKHSDRFYYENNDEHAKFSIAQLDEIRKSTLARVFCDNTDMTSVPQNIFEESSVLINPTVFCSNIPAMNLSKWSERCSSHDYGKWTFLQNC